MSRLWRRAAAVVAIYALVLQGLLLGMSGAAQAARAAGGDSTAAIICLTHEEGGAPSDVPDIHSACLTHCVLCAGVAAVAVAPHPGLGGVAATSRPLRWQRVDWRGSAFFKDLAARPRGPPTA